MSAKEFRGQTFDPDELILDLFEQSCKRENELFHHDFISSYERAQAYLLDKGIIKEEECYYP